MSTRSRVPTHSLVVGNLALWLSGCVPVPHEDHRAPDLTGSLHVAGEPLSAAELRYRVPDVNYEQRAHTDAHGTFAVQGPTEQAWCMGFGDRLDTWELQIQWEGRSVHIHDTGYWGGPRSLSLRCDLDANLTGVTEVTVRRGQRGVDEAGVRCTYAQDSATAP